jgi:hypothetical protein
MEEENDQQAKPADNKTPGKGMLPLPSYDIL